MPPFRWVRCTVPVVVAVVVAAVAVAVAVAAAVVEVVEGITLNLEGAADRSSCCHEEG